MIIISPYSAKLRNGLRNPKNYAYWPELIKLFKNEHIVQLGVEGEERLVEDCFFNLPFSNIKLLLDKAKFFISVDNFFSHFAHYYDKKGAVIWGRSDPKIFGYEDNLNILKNRDTLRQNQFDTWEGCLFDPTIFDKPEVIFKKIKNHFYE